MLKKALCAAIALAVSSAAQAASWQLSGGWGPASSSVTDRRQQLWILGFDENGVPLTFGPRAIHIQSAGCTATDCDLLPATITQFTKLAPGAYKIIFTHDSRMAGVGAIVVSAWKALPVGAGIGGGSLAGTQRAWLYMPRK